MNYSKLLVLILLFTPIFSCKKAFVCEESYQNKLLFFSKTDSTSIPKWGFPFDTIINIESSKLIWGNGQNDYLLNGNELEVPINPETSICSFIFSMNGVKDTLVFSYNSTLEYDKRCNSKYFRITNMKLGQTSFDSWEYDDNNDYWDSYLSINIYL